MRLRSIIGLIGTATVVLAGILLVEIVPGYALGGSAAQSVKPLTYKPGDSVTVEIRQGDNAEIIAERLKSAGVIDNTDLFGELVALEGLQDHLAAGQYDFNKNMAVADIITRLHDGDVGAIKVTIPEGKRVEEVAAIVQGAGLVSAQDFLSAAQAGHYNYDFLTGVAPGSSLEGYLFPDTYNFPRHNKPEDVVNAMLKDFNQRLTPEMRAGFAQQGLSVKQAVTLASIVEREAQLSTERPTIASVFLNRIREGMPLQADPTVQFALAANAQNVARYGWWKQDLTLVDLKQTSPYNTYLQTGLPPGAIANPGQASLEAVAHPAQTNYLYFVAKGDGSHVFAATFAEQQTNIARYQP